MPSIPTRKGTQHYEVHGPADAPWALLLPGAFSAPWQYDSLRDTLAERLRVIEVEYRGSGESKNHLWDVTPPQIAEDMVALLDHLSVERCHVVGVSFGVFVLAELLHRAPSRVGRVAIAGMPALRERVVMPSITAADLQAMPLGLKPMQQAALSLVPIFVSKRFREEQPDRYKDMLDRMLQLRSQDVWAGLKQFYGIFGYDWGRMRIFEEVPLARRLFLTGEEDLLAPMKDVAAHPLLREGPTLLFRGTGHRFFYEDAADFNAIVAEFLERGSLPPTLPGAGLVVPLEVSA